LLVLLGRQAVRLDDARFLPTVIVVLKDVITFAVIVLAAAGADGWWRLVTNTDQCLADGPRPTLAKCDASIDVIWSLRPARRT
jgi:hypothetical protein